MRFKDRIAALEFVRGFLGDPFAMATLRRQLGRHRSDVSRLSDHQVLAEISTLLARGPIHIAHPTRLRVPSSQGNEQQEPAPLRGRLVRPSDKEEEEIYVVAAAVKTIGDTPLVNHKVRILDPDSGKVVVDSLTTDDEGIVRATVPENKKYRIEILDEDMDWPPPLLHSDTEPAVLLCHFVDEGGTPLPNLDIEARSGDDTFELTTDEEGKIESPGHLGHYELKVQDQVFHAHALLQRDRVQKENLYRFVVASSAGDENVETEYPENLPSQYEFLNDENQSV